MIRITIACPETLTADANQLARCIGYSAADDQTYSRVRYQDAAGNRYSAPSGLVGDSFPAAATGTLTAPEWGCNLAAARRAQALITIWRGEDAPFAAPDRLAAVIHDDPEAALAVLGLTLIVAQGGE